MNFEFLDCMLFKLSFCGFPVFTVAARFILPLYSLRCFLFVGKKESRFFYLATYCTCFHRNTVFSTALQDAFFIFLFRTNAFSTPLPVPSVHSFPFRIFISLHLTWIIVQLYASFRIRCLSSCLPLLFRFVAFLAGFELIICLLQNSPSVSTIKLSGSIIFNSLQSACRYFGDHFLILLSSNVLEASISFSYSSLAGA